MNDCTVKGDEPTNPRSAPAPTDAKLADGQHADHWTMCPGEIIKAGFVRPVRALNLGIVLSVARIPWLRAPFNAKTAWK